MTRTSTLDRLPTELAYRRNDGLEVWLLWSRFENHLFVLVVDSKTDDVFEITVESDQALDAFEHPYAHAAFRGVEYREPVRREAEAVAA